MRDETHKPEAEAEQPARRPFDPNEQARRIVSIPFGGNGLSDPYTYRTVVMPGGRKVIIPPL